MRIANDSQRVLSTDYWSSEHARRGFVYLSINAGAIRLLMPAGWPDLQAGRLPMRATLQIVGAQGIGVGHIVLEDGSDAPPYLTLDARQMDRALPEREIGR